MARLKLSSPKSLIIDCFFSQFEQFLTHLDLMDQRFHPANNKTNKCILLKHAYSTRIRLSKLAKMSANVNVTRHIVETVIIGWQCYDSSRYDSWLFDKSILQYRPNVYWPNVCWPNVCQPNVCWHGMNYLEYIEKNMDEIYKCL